MSTDYYCNVGPYIVCDFDKQTKAGFYTGCTNNTCENDKPLESKHCPDCGSLCDKIDKLEEVEVDDRSILDKIDDALAPIYTPYFDQYKGKNIHLYGPNRKNSKFLHRHIDCRHDSNLDIDLTYLNIHLEVLVFEKEYTKELELLKKTYKSVEIKWGLVFYTY